MLDKRKLKNIKRPSKPIKRNSRNRKKRGRTKIIVKRFKRL